MYDLSRLKSVGGDVFIDADVHIKRPHLVSVGNHVAIDAYFYITIQAEIGDYIHIAPFVSCIGGATGLLKMGHFTSIAAGSRIICGSDEHLGYGLVGPTIPSEYRDRVSVKPVILGRFVGIGTNAVIMPGVTLGEGCVIGACSLVLHNTEPWTVYVGIPAIPLKSRPKKRMLEAARKMGY